MNLIILILWKLFVMLPLQIRLRNRFVNNIIINIVIYINKLINLIQIYTCNQ